MARMGTKVISHRVRWYRGERFRKLQKYFTDNEISQGRLNLVGKRNPALREVVRDRLRLLDRLSIDALRERSERNTYLIRAYEQAKGKPDEQTKILAEVDRITNEINLLSAARRTNLFRPLVPGVVNEAADITIRDLRKRGKELSDLLDEAAGT